MEPAALLLLILLPPQDATGNLAVGIKTSLHGELGEVAMAVVPDSLVTPAMWQGENAHMRARFVARVVWNKKTALVLSCSRFPAAPPEPRPLTCAGWHLRSVTATLNVAVPWDW